jgi:hypothetical protein
MARGGRKTLISIALALGLAFSALSTTGVYVVNPIPAVPEGETIWFYRRGTGLPFISSADGLNVARGRGISLDSRSAMNAQIAAIIGNHVLAKFGYSPALYLHSTGNRDFTSLGAPVKATPTPQTAPTP